ncbi:MAG TPA: hypothetical protein VLL08_32475 [Kineosporiaceae bacterium]|nr:hypothetical protein [Kineosporiaceae bacterium]
MGTAAALGGVAAPATADAGGAAEEPAETVAAGVPAEPLGAVVEVVELVAVEGVSDDPPEHAEAPTRAQPRITAEAAVARRPGPLILPRFRADIR